MRKQIILLGCLLTSVIQAQWIQSYPATSIDYLAKVPSFKMNSGITADTTDRSRSKAMLLSLIWPGAGQAYIHDPLWKPVLFSAIEIAGIASHLKWKQTSDRLRWKFESFADDHWELERWYQNTKIIFPDRWQEMIKGTHKLTLDVVGNYTTTDHLIDLLKETSWDQIQVVRDRDFYENIGKYDQFIGGWDDPFDDPFDNTGNWYTVKKGHTKETYILTKRKDQYRGMRHRSNLYSTYARYAATSLMFNHLLSAVEASGLLSRGARNSTVKTDVSFLFNPQGVLGVGGVRLNLYW
jgi:hypothetical protein